MKELSHMRGQEPRVAEVTGRQSVLRRARGLVSGPVAGWESAKETLNCFFSTSPFSSTSEFLYSLYACKNDKNENLVLKETHPVLGTWLEL